MKITVGFYDDGSVRWCKEYSVLPNTEQLAAVENFEVKQVYRFSLEDPRTASEVLAQKVSGGAQEPDPILKDIVEQMYKRLVEKGLIEPEGVKK